MMFFYIPCPNDETARDLAKSAIEEKLAACGNLLGPCQSFYEWDGKFCEETESILILKTAKSRAEALKNWLVQRHPYDTPCVIALPVSEDASHADFLAWINIQSGQKASSS